MPTGRHTQTSLSSGEFDPLLWSREDVSFFYNSARIIENAIALPQGGVKRREGFSYRGLQRGAISAVSLAGKTVTATNGGTAANGTDGDIATLVTTTVEVSTTAAYEIYRLDMATATDISIIDVKGLRLFDLPATEESASVAIQHSSDASTWITAQTMLVGSAAYDRRFAVKPDTILGGARYWRLAIINAIDLTTTKAELAEFLAWSEAGYSAGGSVGEFSIHRLTTDTSNEYTIWVTAGCADVFRMDTGAWVSCIAMLHTNAQVASIKVSPNLDTVIFFHEDVQPWLIQRLGADGDWRSGAVDFDSVVHFPFDSGNTIDGQNEEHFLRFESMSVGDTLAIEFAGNISDKITWTTNHLTNRAALEAAIEGLQDFTNATVTARGSGANADFEIEYLGNKEKEKVAIIIVDILTGSGTVVASRTQSGRKAKDLLWSETRGYPRCGAFYQGRQWIGGFKARPDLIVGSRAGSLFDFKEDTDPVAGSPIVVAPNVDDQITIQNIYPGRHLQIFTSSAEMYIPEEPITIDNVALKTTSRHGANVNTQPVDVQGGTLFTDRNGRALREYLFQDAEQSYSAEPVSILAGHLMASPRSLVLRRARDVDEPTLLLIANTGLDRAGVTVPAAMCVIDRSQQVTGFFRVKTPGTPLAFSTSQNGDGFAVTRRDLAGPEWNYLEQFDDQCMSDAGVRISGSGSTVDLTGVAEHLEGQEVYVHVDGLPIGEFTVTSLSIDLGDESFSAEVEVGLRMVPRIVLHPYKGRGETSPTMQSMRIFRVLLQMERTGGIAIGTSGGVARPVSLQNYDSGLMDPTLEEVLFSGSKRLSGIGRWQVEPTLEITQIEPMPFLLRSLSYDVRF
jgi:hypothetical protein